MKNACFILIVSIYGYCGKSKIAAAEKFRLIEIDISMPIITADTSFVARNSYKVAYHEKTALYKFPYTFNLIETGTIATSKSMDMFFAVHKDSSFGSCYYPGENAVKRYPVDSFLKTHRFEPFTIDKSIFSKPDSVYSDVTNNLILVYNTRPDSNASEQFSMYFHYSSLFNGIPENLSTNMDTARGKKLFMVRIVGHGHYYAENKLTLPEREYRWEMRQLPIENEGELLSYFTRYDSLVHPRKQ